MKFNRQMIDLAKAIRRQAEGEEKAKVKMSDPNLLATLHEMYISTNDMVMMSLISEFFSLAMPSMNIPTIEPGPQLAFEEDEWPQGGGDDDEEDELMEEGDILTAPMEEAEHTDEAKKKVKRIYRGQVIYE